MHNSRIVSNAFNIFLIFLVTFSLHAHDILLIDTAGKQEYCYRSLKLLANSVGYTVQYKNLYNLLEHPLDIHHDTVFFMIDISFLQQLTTPIAQRSIALMQHYAQQQHKTIGILLPCTNQYSLDFVQQCMDFIAQLGIVPSNYTGNTEQFLSSFLQPDFLIGQQYGTTLVAKKSFTDTVSYDPLTILSNSIDIPVNTPSLGLLLHNTMLDTYCFISKLSFFNFADIEENFYINPRNPEQRTFLLAQAQKILWQVYHTTNPYAPDVDLMLPHELMPSYSKEQKYLMDAKREHTLSEQYYPLMREGIRLGWLSPGDFFLYEDPLLQQLSTQEKAERTAAAIQRGIDFIYDANLNALWFEFNAEEFLSPHGRNKDHRQEFIEQVRTIVYALKEKFHEKPLPKIFIGTDITSNFSHYPVGDPVQDIFGTLYDRIPAPFDIEQYWKTELLDIFDEFCAIFSQDIPIDGIFLDFEMYHAQQQANGYTDLMDFSNSSWVLFCAKTGAPYLSTAQERINYILQNVQSDHYFSILEAAARELGCFIKQHLRKRIPHLLIGAYTPTVPHSWFYRGIMAGLSSEQEPLILATFNTDFYSHASWLIQHSLYALHGSVALLSHFKDSNDFLLISKQQNYHDFIWYNRVSREIYRDYFDTETLQKQWWTPEISSLPTSIVATGIKGIGHKKHKA